MKKNIFLIFLIFLIFFFVGCVLDPYKNEKYAKLVIDNWFNYQNGDDDLGKTRRKIENISTIEDTNCEFVTKYKNSYIYKCIIEYKEIGETVIPFANAKKKNVYAVFTPLKGDKYTYKVYNSKSKDKVWENDEELELVE